MRDRGSTGHIPALTGLRGVAACLVVLYHLHYGPSAGWDWQQAIDNGHLAVDVFFMLSGFLMIRAYGGLFVPGSGWKAVGTFLLRRLARVYPLYLLATGLFIVLCAAGMGGGEPVTPLHVALNLTMTQHWFTRVSYDPPGWSVSAEFAAYLLFPLLLPLVRRAFVGATALLCVLGLYVVSIAPEAAAEWHLGPFAFSKGSPLFVLLRCVSGFTLGMIAFRVSGHAFARRALGVPLVTAGVPVLFLALLAAPDQQLAAVALVPLLLVTLTAQRSVAVRLLGGRVGVFLGDISYAVYLFHWLLQLARLEGGQFVPAYVLLITVSWLLYRCVEIPARVWVMRLPTRRSPEARLQSA